MTTELNTTSKIHQGTASNFSSVRTLYNLKISMGKPVFKKFLSKTLHQLMESNIYNLSSYIMSNYEKIILEKGLNFVYSNNKINYFKEIDREIQKEITNNELFP